MRARGLREIDRETQALKRKLGLSAGEFADLAAKAVRNSVVKNTQPMGLAKKALEDGKSAIAYDLSKVFKVVPDAARGRRGVISSISEAKTWHNSRRGSRGRTRGGQKRKIIQSVYRMYLQILWKKVGTAKGSVLGGDPAALSGIKGPWIRRHKKEGSSSRKKSIFGAIWEFAADPPHVASSNVLGERGVKRAMKWKERSLRTLLKRKMRAEIKKAERRVNRG